MLSHHLRRLEAAAELSQRPKKELAELAGIHENTIRLMRGAGTIQNPRRGPWNPLSSTIMKLEHALAPELERIRRRERYEREKARTERARERARAAAAAQPAAA